MSGSTPPAGDTDLLLVERAVAGDQRAFELLVLKYERRIQRLIARMAGAEFAILLEALRLVRARPVAALAAPPLIALLSPLWLLAPLTIAIGLSVPPWVVGRLWSSAPAPHIGAYRARSTE